MTWRFVTAIGLACVLAACSSLPSSRSDRQEREPPETDRRTFIADSRYVYGQGFGNTREQAVQGARDELAEMVLVNVRTDTRQELREASDQEITREFVSSSFSWSNVELENVRIDFEERVRGTQEWYVRLRIDRATMQRLTDQARRKAPALNAVYQIEQTSRLEPALRLQRAVAGLAIAERDGVHAQTFIQESGSQATFETYFADVMDASARAMKAVPLLHENRDRISFVLLHQTSSRPQANMPLILRVGYEELEVQTDSRGYTEWLPIDSLGSEFRVLVRTADFTEENSRVERFRELDRYTVSSFLNSREALVYFYVDPSDANVRIDHQSLGSPTRHALQSGRTYDLSVRSERHRPRDETLRIPEGAAFGFRRVELEARQYGSLELSVADRQAVIQVRRDLDPIERSTGNTFRREVAEAGSYAVRVGRLKNGDFDPNYQITQDLFELESEQVYAVDYPAPRYRHPYRRGWRVGLYTLRMGGQPRPGYRVPYERAFSDDYQQTWGQVRRDLGPTTSYVGATSDDVVLSIQRYFNALNFTVQGSVGIQHNELNVVRLGLPEQRIQLMSTHASIGAGFWMSLWGDMVLTSLTANQAIENASWDSDIPLSFTTPDNDIGRIPMDGSLSNRYQFLEWSTHVGLEYAGLTLSVVTPIDAVRPSVRLGVAFTMIKSGYRRPAIIRR
ncbi:MAG: hypothetical protein JJU10_07730 [Idiomarina sp.]|nr:hypothetical protein [Idiomarina sp.]